MDILLYPNPALRRVCKPLKKIDKFIHNAIKEMVELVYGRRALGLAANQVGLPYRFFVVKPSPSYKEIVFINPII